MDDEYCLHAVQASMEIAHCKHVLSLRTIKGFEILSVFFLWLVKVYLSCFWFQYLSIQSIRIALQVILQKHYCFEHFHLGLKYFQHLIPFSIIVMITKTPVIRQIILGMGEMAQQLTIIGCFHRGPWFNSQISHGGS